MPYTVRGRENVGAYDHPFSGVGVEYYPLGMDPGRSGITLHETGFLPKNQNWNYPAVFSPFWRACYNAEAGHCVLLGERIVELTPDHIVLIPGHCLFHCLGENPVPSFWLTFSFVKTLNHALTVPVLLPPRDTELCLIRDLKALIAATTSWEPTDTIYHGSLALLHILLSRPELTWQPPVPENLVRVAKHIEEHVADKLSNTSLARLAGMSVAGFNRAFKRHYGISPSRHLLQMRVRRASQELLQGTASIEIIAEATGFPNRAHFSRAFKKVTNESPAAFRRKHRRRPLPTNNLPPCVVTVTSLTEGRNAGEERSHGTEHLCKPGAGKRR